jgi:hypothetical protein
MNLAATIALLMTTTAAAAPPGVEAADPQLRGGPQLKGAQQLGSPQEGVRAPALSEAIPPAVLEEDAAFDSLVVNDLSHCNADSLRATIIGEFDNANGKYFKFNGREFQAAIGVPGNGGFHQICQWSNGIAIWSGTIKTWWGLDVGRAEPRKAVFHWPVGDEISAQDVAVPPTVPSMAPQCNANNPRLPITGIKNGKYFKFDPDELKTALGGKGFRQVCQWRNGNVVWQGTVRVWSKVGRADPPKAEFDWLIGDEISVQGDVMY